MILIIGLPNAGKTTYSMQFEKVVHLDSFSGGKYKQCIIVASQIDDVCVDGVFHQKSRRIDLLAACNGHFGKRICIWLDTPIDVCLRREQEGRKRPDMIIKNLAAAFEPPTYDEGWDEIIIVKDGKETLLPRQEV